MSEQDLLFNDKIPAREKIAYGAAGSANVFLSGIGLGSINIFYIKVLHLDPALIAISWLLFIAWNMFNDPIIGVLQDKTKSKLGRRIPYLRYGAPIYALSFIWIWFPFTNIQEILFWNHLLMLFVFDTLFSMMGLILYSMPAEMATSADERGSIMIYAVALGAIGTAGSIILPIVFLGNVPNVEGFRITMVILGIISGAAIFISSYYIKEKKYTQKEETLGFWESIKVTFKNKPFLIVEIAIFSTVIMQNVLTSYFVFLFDYAVDVSMNLLNIILIIITLLILGISVYWLNTKIEKYGVKKLMIVGGIVAAIGFLILLILGLNSNVNQFNRLDFSQIFIPLSCIIFGLIAALLLNQPLMADCIDNDEVLTGKRRETTYSGVNALITKPAVSIGQAVFLWIIDFYGYDENISDPLLQNVNVATGVIVAFTLIPIICLIIAVIALFWFPLDGEDWKRQKKRLFEIHQQKEKEYKLSNFE